MTIPWILRGRCPDDPKDDYLVALAQSGGAGILVTRDRHFEKVDVEGLRIINPGQALALMPEADTKV